jgi:hypothetical protein
MPSHLVSRRMIRAASALALGAALAVPTALAGTASAVTSSATAAVQLLRLAAHLHGRLQPDQ